MITEVRVPDPGPRTGGTYLKLERKVGDFATAGVGVQVTLDNGNVGEVGIGLTGVGATNLRASAAEDALRGGEPTDGAIAAAARLAAEAAEPQSDNRGTAEYKRNVVRVFTRAGPSDRDRGRPGRRGVSEMTELRIADHGGALHRVEVTVNGEERAADVEARTLLVHFIRETLGLTGTHIGCDTTSCGACTVLVDGMPVKSCTMFAVQANGAEITTVEGLRAGRQLHPIQQAFHEEHGLQCGFCTPGMMLTSVALLAENPSPTDEEIRWAISGQICRCTGYQNIVKAVQSAATTMREGRRWRRRTRSAGSATPSSARRTRGSSAARAGTSTTSRCRGCSTWRSSAAPTRTRASTAIDTSRAEALDGVVAVVTGELLAQHNLAWMPTLSGDTQAVLATDKVRYQGQEVACVIAESAYVAKDALELIEVDYDPLPASRARSRRWPTTRR